MIPESINSKIGVNLHKQKGHPIYNIRRSIEGYFGWHTFDDLNPVVSVADNFDLLLIPEDHPSRKKTDTFYVDDTHVLRTHTSAHQNQLLKTGYKKFVVFGDVYRKDEIDCTHYPVFHQVEAVCVLPDANNAQRRLHNFVEGVLRHLMGTVKIRKVESYFPFTNPSWEYEVFWEGRWLELAGCGIIQPQILKQNNVHGVGWAVGMGLERIAMALYGIPDVRLFWSKDERFLKQFENPYQKVTFKEFSSQPPCHKDIAFWTRGEFSQTEYFQMIREVAGDLVEDVQCVDTFVKGDGRTSLCYRITYRSMERTLTNEEVNSIQDKVRANTAKNFNIELR